MGLQGTLSEQAANRARSIREALGSQAAKMFMSDAQKQFSSQTADLLEELAKELKRLGGGYV